MTDPGGAAARGERRRVPVRVAAPALALALALLVLLGLASGSAGSIELPRALAGLRAELSLGEPLSGLEQTIFRLRLHRTLVAVGVGAALALSGAYLQGMFRNPLASPSLIGVTAGSGLGSALAVLALGGYGPDVGAALGASGVLAPLFVTAAAFAGALLAALVVLRLAAAGGRVSVPSLLLAGIALNTCLAGVLAALQSWTLRDYEVHRAILAWTFGTLEDRAGYHVAIVWGGLAVAALAIPFVAVELDLFRGGEEDAQALGVDVRRVKLAATCAAALAAGSAVAVAGQISFVGLVVPHILRLVVGPSHRTLLPLCLLFGGVFLLGADLLQRTAFAGSQMQPGVLMSLVGGPFFLLLLWRERRSLSTW